MKLWAYLLEPIEPSATSSSSLQSLCSFWISKKRFIKKRRLNNQIWFKIMNFISLRLNLTIFKPVPKRKGSIVYSESKSAKCLNGPNKIIIRHPECGVIDSSSLCRCRCKNGMNLDKNSTIIKPTCKRNDDMCRQRFYYCWRL